MKRKINLLLFVTALIFKMNAQVTFYESFDAPFFPTVNGWSVQNLSSSPGSNAAGWYQGNSFRFPALAGVSIDDYYAADMNAASAAGTTNTISAWLITPTLNLVNGAIIQFATLGSDLPAKADRLQLYYSLGAGSNVGATAGTATNSAGTFTNIIMDANAAMQSSGYPTEWAVFTFTLSGIATPSVGRLGFRYYIPNGGAAGANGNYIGIDEFRYMNPCSRPNFSASWTNNICVGNPLNLQATNSGGSANPVTSYTWSNGANTSTTSVVPTHTGINSYYCLEETTPGCVSLDPVNAWAMPSPVLTTLFNPNVVCSGGTVTVTASGATTYTYFFGAAAPSTINPIVLVAPIVNTLTTGHFTVVGTGAFNCIGGSYININVFPNPTVTAVFSQSVVCINKTVTLTADGAITYSWSGASSSTVNPLTINTGTTIGVKQFTLYGLSQIGCKSEEVISSVTVSRCTGIENFKDESEISVYPNPFKNQLNIENFNGSLEIYNALGQLTLHLKPEQLKVIDTSELAAGVYILKAFSTSGEKRNFRLVKNE